MICNHCGNEMDPNAKFCGVCGAPNEAAAQPQYAQPAQPQYAQPQYAQPQSQYGAAPAVDLNEREMSKSTLTMGILGIAFGVSFYLSFLGIIFGAIAKQRALAYMAAGYPLTGRAKTGSILGKIGFVFGIVFTAIFVVYLLIIIIGVASA